MDGACRIYTEMGGEETGSWFRNLRERYHLEVLGIDGSLKLNWIFKK
jgi:hypothetical protein